jgi:hypothetical protein
VVLPLSFVKKTVYVKIKDVAALLMEARGPATGVMANWRKAGRTGRCQASTPRVYTIARTGASTNDNPHPAFGHLLPPIAGEGLGVRAVTGRRQ